SAKAKATIRLKKTSIFDAKNGARGWIAGPFICLWFSAFDRYGPMLFGLISADNLGTRVHGRAGSDLNGVLMFTLLIPLMAWLVFKMISEGQATGRALFVIALIFLVGGPLMYWWAHKERKDAEPLVRFLRKTLAQPDARSKSTVGARRIQDGLRLILNGNCIEGPVTEEALQSALMRVGNRDFLIVEAGPQDYLQTASHDGGYILEVRKGGPGEHYRAIRNNGSVRGPEKAKEKFTFEEVSAAIAAYISGESLHSLLSLQPMAPHR
ncbi:MAG: hypothetical protein KJ703_05505, partial [Alphaproteobacteria bacterium]|nr:hypothetical protein [Alphaproteobacteria bacterium]MBU1756429.1 hypothetical protein [Alphaproteobacteria bacterium]